MMTDASTAELADRVRGWLVFFALATAGTVVIVAINSASAASTWVVVAIVLGTQAVYALIARPALVGIRTNRPQAWVFAAVAVLGLGPAVYLNPWATASLFALTPEVFLLFTFANGAIVTGLLNAVAAAGQILLGPGTVRSIVESVGIAVFILTFSLFFGSRVVIIAQRSAERLQLIEALREREAEVAALSAARGAEAERTRIAREMHDTLAQGFTSIVTLGHAVLAELDNDVRGARRHVELITRTAGENLAESRRIIRALAPAPLDGASLLEAMERIVATFAEETSVSARVVIEGAATAAAPQVEVVALRVVQECLSNARKHAAANRLEVTVRNAPQALSVTVRDDGVGFDPAATSNGFGLAGMQARVKEIGGTLSVVSLPGAGTVVTAHLPLEVTG